MKKTLKRDIITGINIGDIIELTNGEKIKVSFIAESKSYLGGRLHETEKRDQFDDGERQSDKYGIKKSA